MHHPTLVFSLLECHKPCQNIKSFVEPEIPFSCKIKSSLQLMIFKAKYSVDVRFLELKVQVIEVNEIETYKSSTLYCEGYFKLLRTSIAHIMASQKSEPQTTQIKNDMDQLPENLNHLHGIY